MYRNIDGLEFVNAIEKEEYHDVVSGHFHRLFGGTGNAESLCRELDFLLTEFYRGTLFNEAMFHQAFLLTRVRFFISSLGMAEGQRNDFDGHGSLLSYLLNFGRSNAGKKDSHHYEWCGRNTFLNFFEEGKSVHLSISEYLDAIAFFEWEVSKRGMFADDFHEVFWAMSNVRSFLLSLQKALLKMS